ncbi:hypothetical protein E2C01_000606 [Portunus trituberculatus]|uniref:Uncharacterized protein n=1 Tax=Portunus trituberculatus TaxID=210409 RepID=A0A5B7CH08_PORTR|nr:hypothetical protein [Portunus trituberculatus]
MKSSIIQPLKFPIKVDGLKGWGMAQQETKSLVTHNTSYSQVQEMRMCWPRNLKIKLFVTLL